jgi:DNA-binding XRE family transcriptional regulator
MSHNLTLQLAKKISMLGNKQGFTIQTLAKKAELSTSTIRSILQSGITPYNPKISTVQKLAKAFRAPMTEFFDFSKSRKQNNQGYTA